MAENLEVAQSGSEGELSEDTRHEVVAAQLRGEAKAAGKGPEALIAAVAEEIAELGLEPDPSELHRRYEEIDPDVPQLRDDSDGGVADDSADAADPDADPAHDTAVDAPADAPVDSPRVSGADGPVAAGTDAGRDRPPVDDASGPVAR